jgi:hypothetical protein
MSADWPPKKNTAFDMSISLPAQAQDNTFVNSPTIAAGDFQVSKDDGAFANLTNLPTVTPAGSKIVKLSLTAAEMNADKVVILCSDAAGAEWKDVMIELRTVTRQIVDVAYAGMALTEGYAADGAAFTLEQALYEIAQQLEEKSVSGTTVTIKKRDGTTTAMVLTLSPDGTNPTAITRSS